MISPKGKYKSKDDVKIGDIVYMAEFIAVNGQREACSIELVVHDVDGLGNVAVRNAHNPGEPFYGSCEWTPSWTALYASDKDALDGLYYAASRGWV